MCFVYYYFGCWTELHCAAESGNFNIHMAKIIKIKASFSKIVSYYATNTCLMQIRIIFKKEYQSVTTLKPLAGLL